MHSVHVSQERLQGELAIAPRDPRVRRAALEVDVVRRPGLANDRRIGISGRAAGVPDGVVHDLDVREGTPDLRGEIGHERAPSRVVGWPPVDLGVHRAAVCVAYA